MVSEEEPHTLDYHWSCYWWPIELWGDEKGIIRARCLVEDDAA